MQNSSENSTFVAPSSDTDNITPISAVAAPQPATQAMQVQDVDVNMTVQVVEQANTVKLKQKRFVGKPCVFADKCTIPQNLRATMELFHCKDCDGYYHHMCANKVNDVTTTAACGCKNAVLQQTERSGIPSTVPAVFAKGKIPTQEEWDKLHSDHVVQPVKDKTYTKKIQAFENRAVAASADPNTRVQGSWVYPEKFVYGLVVVLQCGVVDPQSPERDEWITAFIQSADWTREVATIELIDSPMNLTGEAYPDISFQFLVPAVNFLLSRAHRFAYFGMPMNPVDKTAWGLRVVDTSFELSTLQYRDACRVQSQTWLIVGIFLASGKDTKIMLLKSPCTRDCEEVHDKTLAVRLCVAVATNFMKHFPIVPVAAKAQILPFNEMTESHKVIVDKIMARVVPLASRLISENAQIPTFRDMTRNKHALVVKLPNSVPLSFFSDASESAQVAVSSKSANKSASAKKQAESTKPSSTQTTTPTKRPRVTPVTPEPVSDDNAHPQANDPSDESDESIVPPPSVKKAKLSPATAKNTPTKSGHHKPVTVVRAKKPTRPVVPAEPPSPMAAQSANTQAVWERLNYLQQQKVEELQQQLWKVKEELKEFESKLHQQQASEVLLSKKVNDYKEKLAAAEQLAQDYKHQTQKAEEALRAAAQSMDTIQTQHQREIVSLKSAHSKTLQEVNAEVTKQKEKLDAMMAVRVDMPRILEVVRTCIQQQMEDSMSQVMTQFGDRVEASLDRIPSVCEKATSDVSDTIKSTVRTTCEEVAKNSTQIAVGLASAQVQSIVQMQQRQATPQMSMTTSHFPQPSFYPAVLGQMMPQVPQQGFLTSPMSVPMHQSQMSLMQSHQQQGQSQQSSHQAVQSQEDMSPIRQALMTRMRQDKELLDSLAGQYPQ